MQSVPITISVVSSNPAQARCTWYNIMCLSLSVAGQWFSQGIQVSSTNKTDCHDITEILLKVALNTINQTKHIFCILLIRILTLRSTCTKGNVSYCKNSVICKCFKFKFLWNKFLLWELYYIVLAQSTW